MKKSDIDRFFTLVAKEMSFPAQIYLTGGIASWFMGGSRPTRDIDFGLRVAKARWNEIEKVLNDTSRKLGIPIEFTENLSRWSMIDIPDYEKKATLHKKFGTLSVYILDVGSWSLGKIARYLPSDIDDLIKVFLEQKPPPRHIVKIWGRALKTSPRSTSQILFRKTVEDFLSKNGKRIWGKNAENKKLIALFNEAAGITLKT